ncbi:hypothetical protein HUA74_24030 [Myxococcus sp. CA051A]|uniref:Lipoprotein n=1 Tax=Myxococcus llanfairpwllgwyngyllgogerychwyrndrobwllllantysiliogogogochensis TaxID=2590453 RepID=A0A540WVJ8_9BACT|nr:MULTISPECIES: hypothetical protein [Myxococcus]NTX04650.1 hypothetical protein [Myxococcus sp. CA040A]NTX14995.1 hypothetical protein [Myxococcus sp. CA056]NTX63730.1 hypothetical protein [Myxococcus sp. CA051A]TQF13042.1 hypothetical protein FJV41_26040 [Myxococcus llanfairpwllgwyngyllgogerychwyrndrobwllllantysiliogogogochensis]
MSRMNLAGLLAMLLLASAGVVEAKQWRYAGMHPRTGQPADGLCHMEMVHVHTAAPLHADTLYRTRENVYVFIGDPTPFGYEGPRHAYYGHHPVVLNVLVNISVDRDVVEYCYHDGPHYHSYEPPPRHEFVEKEDVSYYAGEYPQEYKQGSPSLVRVNTVYRSWSAPRPVITVGPPPEYRGPVIQVGLNIPVPSVEIRVGGPPPPPPPPEWEGRVVREERVHVHHDHCDHHEHKKHKKHKKHKHKKYKGRD